MIGAQKNQLFRPSYFYEKCALARWTCPSEQPASWELNGHRAYRLALQWDRLWSCLGHWCLYSRPHAAEAQFMAAAPYYGKTVIIPLCICCGECQPPILEAYDDTGNSKSGLDGRSCQVPADEKWIRSSILSSPKKTAPSASSNFTLLFPRKGWSSQPAGAAPCLRQLKIISSIHSVSQSTPGLKEIVLTFFSGSIAAACLLISAVGIMMLKSLSPTTASACRPRKDARRTGTAERMH